MAGSSRGPSRPDLLRARRGDLEVRLGSASTRRRAGGSCVHAGLENARALHRHPGRVEERECRRAVVLGIRPGADRDPARYGRRQGPGDHATALPASGCADPGPTASPGARDPGRWRGRRGPVVLRGARVGSSGDSCGADGPRRHGPAPLHQRDDRSPEGCGPCPWCGPPSLHVRSICPRSPP